MNTNNKGRERGKKEEREQGMKGKMEGKLRKGGRGKTRIIDFAPYECNSTLIISPEGLLILASDADVLSLHGTWAAGLLMVPGWSFLGFLSLSVSRMTRTRISKELC